MLENQEGDIIVYILVNRWDLSLNHFLASYECYTDCHMHLVRNFLHEIWAFEETKKIMCSGDLQSCILNWHFKLFSLLLFFLENMVLESNCNSKIDISMIYWLFNYSLFYSSILRLSIFNYFWKIIHTSFRCFKKAFFAFIFFTLH